MVGRAGFPQFILRGFTFPYEKTVPLGMFRNNRLNSNAYQFNKASNVNTKSYVGVKNYIFRECSALVGEEMLTLTSTTLWTDSHGGFVNRYELWLCVFDQ
jgi:hypothetical protein